MKTLNKAFDIMELFLDSGEELTLAELARLSRLNKSTVCRIVSTMAKRGYLKQPRKWGAYSLGTKYLDYSGVIKNRLKVRDVAFPHLVELKNKLNESVIMVLWDGKEAVIHEIFHALHTLKVAPDEGTKMPLHCTASGKIILANLKAGEFQKYSHDIKLETYTPNTIIDIKELKKQLIVVRQRGVAFDDEEFSLGVRGVSSGIKDNQGNIIGTIGAIGPSVRLTYPSARDIVPEIRSYALRISRELGYKGG
jgi:IclR family KDG regulon transcriptional repressor